MCFVVVTDSVISRSRRTGLRSRSSTCSSSAAGTSCTSFSPWAPSEIPSVTVSASSRRSSTAAPSTGSRYVTLYYYTYPHPKDGEGTVFTGVCKKMGGGYLDHLSLVSGPFWGARDTLSWSWLMGGGIPVRSWGRVPPPPQPPGQDQDRVPTPLPQPGLGRGTPSPSPSSRQDTPWTGYSTGSKLLAFLHRGLSFWSVSLAVTDANKAWRVLNHDLSP